MNILDKILEVKKEEVQLLKKKYLLSSFESMEFFEKSGLSLKERLNVQSHLSIIAEIKKASPSKGVLKKDFNHLSIAGSYLNNDVDAISILTDKQFFQGKIDYMYDVSKISNVPLLRKDFIIDEYQVFEAKAFGADVILLIAEALTQTQIKYLTQTALEIGLEVLLEIHSDDQIGKIDFGTNKIIGINNRDLKTFVVDLNTTLNLKKLLPTETLVVSESGISNQRDIELLKTNNVNGILIGEYLMRSENIKDQLNQLRTWCRIEN